MAKKILVYTNHFDPEHFKINEVVNWLLNSGAHVHVITGLPNYPEGKIYSGYGIFKKSYEKKQKLTVRRLPLITRGRASKFRLSINYLSYFISTIFYTIYLILSKQKFDKVLVHHTSPFFIVVSASIYIKMTKTKGLLWELDLWPETLKAVGIISSKMVFKLIEKIVKKTYKYYETILVGSYNFKSIILERSRHSNVKYFPNWAEEILEINKTDPSFNFDFDIKKLKIMYTGNIGFAQGFDKLCEIIKENKINNLQWIFIGEGRFKSRMKELLSVQIANKEVVFISKQKLEILPSWIAKADFMYLSLNNSELFKNTVPAKLQGYMAMGKPILASISGEGKKIISSANCGFISQPENKKIFISMLKKALKTNHQDRIKLGENGKNYYFQNFSIKLRKKQLINLI